MCTYETIRPKALNGDIALVQGAGIVSSLIRVMTGSSFSHVGVLIWIDEALFVAEYKEFKGYNITPASTWFKSALDAGNTPYFGKAPIRIRESESGVFREALKFRKKPYGYFSLVKVWLSQVTGMKIKVRRFVCSTFVQYVWSKADYHMKKTADPDDIARAATTLIRIAG